MEIVIALAVVAAAVYWFMFRDKPEPETVNAPYKVETPPEPPAAPILPVAEAPKVEVVAKPKAKAPAKPKAKAAAKPKAAKTTAKKPRAKPTSQA